MRVIDGEVYLSPLEAAAMLGVSYKTLQRWVEKGEVNAWAANGTGGGRRRAPRPVHIDVRYTPTGYRLYGEQSIRHLREQFAETS